MARTLEAGSAGTEKTSVNPPAIQVMDFPIPACGDANEEERLGVFRRVRGQVRACLTDRLRGR